MKNVLKSDHFYYSTTLLITSMFLIISGIIIIIGNKVFYFNLMNILISIILLLSIIQFIKYLFYNKNKDINFLTSFLYLTLGIIIYSFKGIPLSFLPIIFAIYMIINGIIKLISYILLLKTKSNGKLLNIFLSIIYLLIGIPLLFSPLKNISTMLIILGIYSILLGINFLLNFININIPLNIKSKLRSRFRITLPSFLAAIIPYQVLKEINSYILNNNQKKLDYKKNTKDYNLEIFIHVAPTSYNKFGHVDICINNKIISYGAYDTSTSRFFNMIGDGMIFTVDRNRYINYCTKYSNKTLFCFRLKLNDKQLKKVNERINSIMNNVIKYKTPYELNNVNKKIKYRDYPSNLVRKAKASFFKVNSGTFKTFFILGVNCCRLANYIIGNNGNDILKISGIITPGTYYEYLNQELYIKNSIVVSKIIYNNKNSKLK